MLSQEYLKQSRSKVERPSDVLPVLFSLSKSTESKQKVQRERMQRLVQNAFSFKLSTAHQPEALTPYVSL